MSEMMTSREIADEFGSTIEILAESDRVALGELDSATRRIEAKGLDLWPKSQAVEPLPEKLNRFQVIERLGTGAQSEVFRAHDPVLDREVAIKVTTDHPEVLREEARRLARLKHTGTVTAYDFIEDAEAGGLLVLELVNGKTLRSSMADGMDRREAVRILACICRQLNTIHQTNNVHRDLKPENILIENNDGVWLIDLGLMFDEEDWRAHLGEVAGTLPYMAPETIRGRSNEIDGRADIWSLGVILYELLTRKRPFGGDRGELESAIRNRRIKPLRQIDPTIPMELERICLKCLQRDPENRYSNAADLENELKRWLDRTAPASRRNLVYRALAWTVGFVLLFVTAIAAFEFGRSSTSKSDELTNQKRDNSGSVSTAPIRVLHLTKTDKKKPIKWFRKDDSIVVLGSGRALIAVGKHKHTKFDVTCDLDSDMRFPSGLFWNYRSSELRPTIFYSISIRRHPNRGFLATLEKHELRSNSTNRSRLKDMEFPDRCNRSGNLERLETRLRVVVEGKKGKVILKGNGKEVSQDFTLPVALTEGGFGVYRVAGSVEATFISPRIGPDAKKNAD